MTPLAVAQLVSTVVSSLLLTLVGIGVARHRIAAVTAGGLVVVIGVQAVDMYVRLADWQIRDPWLVGFVAVLATYPDGRFVPRWTRFLTAGVVVTALIDVAMRGLVLDEVSPVVLPTLTLLMLGCQVYRYRRRATLEERMRVRWPILLTGWAAIALMSMPLLTGTAIEVGTGWPAATATLLLLAIPAGFVIGLVHPRLADVDRLLHGSIEWLVVAGSAVGGYLASSAVAPAVGIQAVDAAALLVATAVGLAARRPAALVAERFVGAVAADPVRALAVLAEQFERSLDGEELATSIASTTTEALLLRAVHVTVDGVAAASVGGEQDGDDETFDVVYQHEHVGAIRAWPRRGDASLASRDRDLLRLIAAHAGPAMHAVRVVAELRHAREQLLLAREEERRRLRRDLHDELAPQLAGLALAGAAVRRLVTTDAASAAELAGRLADDVRHAAQQVREIAYDLRPPALDDLGLSAAIADRVTRPIDGDALRVSVEAPSQRLELPAAVELAALRIVQEAVANTRKHAAARSCQVVLTRTDRELVVDVADDGCGIPEGARSGIGMRSMAERAAELGGQCAVTSSASGTRVAVRLPISDGGAM